MVKVLILGSAPYAVAAADWDRGAFDYIVAINNAWRIRPDWSHMIHPEDFPQDRRPVLLESGQTVVTAEDYVPAQNIYGGFVYAGGTMAFTAGYWALAALQPTHLCYFGCDMVYPQNGKTHFYGTGTADPLRDDVTLANLEAKARRLEVFAGLQGCATVNLSPHRSVLPYQRANPGDLDQIRPTRIAPQAAQAVRLREQELGYFVPSGRYWEHRERFSPAAIAEVDAAWLGCFSPEVAAVA
ncbi:hypothetical protein [Tritonibacter horizontis]|uniref:Uncharacterized protein n=1 Tax=Tritonibacter horizontis TaxID=1768241 RepID=A0A132BU94_9RHOB|nr:hypothetical protein [Tritonibacter horizontis]KUP91864.1 hypothetical protein TRIHO_32840 [Tritonibacter horizontis]